MSTNEFVTEPASVAEASPRDFKDTPEKKALDDLVLEALKEFQEKELAEGRQLMLTRYVQLFEKKNHLPLKAAIKQASAKCGLPPISTNAKVYLSEVPGVEVFEQGLTTCVCLAGSTDVVPKESDDEQAFVCDTDYSYECNRDQSGFSEDTFKVAEKLILMPNAKNGRRLDELLRGERQSHPEAEARFKEIERLAEQMRQAAEAARHAGKSGRPLTPVLAGMASFPINHGKVQEALEVFYRKGANEAAAARQYFLRNKEKIFAARKLKKETRGILCSQSITSPKNETKTCQGNIVSKTSRDLSVPVFLPGTRHPNVLPFLQASSKWTVLIDETGTDFSASATGKNEGKVVGLFIPQETKLRDLHKLWHAVDQGLDGEDGLVAVAESIYNSKCGIIGIPVSAIPGTTTLDQWFSCVEDVLELGLRILPFRGPTEISISVEQRSSVCGQEGTAMLRRSLEGIMHRLARLYPDRGRAFTITAEVIAKDGHPWNGYVDLLAYLWGSPRFSFLADRLGWRNACYLGNHVAGELRRALDALRMESIPNATDWANLIAAPEAGDGSSLVYAFLEAQGHEAQSNIEVWKNCLDEVRSHLDSKAIDMRVLGRQLRWLREWIPTEAALPPRMRLLWLASQLATANHSGRTDLHGEEGFRREFDVLVSQLYREDCPLCAHAKLHLAVSYTNAFEFEKARALLRPMREWPVEGVGLRMKGRLLSSLGQHEAFLGNPTDALPLFDEAISHFGELSESSAGEIAQTGAYAATAAMDAKTPDADNRLAAYLWGGPFSEEKFADEARRLSTSSKPIEKYAHHILLRRLVELPENHPARAAYLSQKGNWAEPSVGHPWELIEFYRALLLPEGDERNARLDSACELALADDGGPTLQVIAAVMKGTAFCIEGAKADPEAYGNLVACCAEALPALGESRLAALRGQLDPATRLAPLDLARAVLPFNFR